jgi:hypothetical protein
MRARVIGVAASACAALSVGCWESPAHELDTDGVFAGDDTSADADADADGDASIVTGRPQGDLPSGWEGFGTACVDDEDCAGYPGSDAMPRRCLTDVLGLVNAPNGFCTACCNAEAIDGCAPNVDCVGLNDTYLICLSHCDKMEDCRVSEGWECRPIWYMNPATFPGTYCLPDQAHVETDTDQLADDPQCPWPWL